MCKVHAGHLFFAEMLPTNTILSNHYDSSLLWAPQEGRGYVAIFDCSGSTFWCYWGCLKRTARARSARALQRFGRLAVVVETHTLWYFGHHCCLVVGFDALGIWHFWMFTLFHPFLLFCTHFLPISTTSTLFLG